MWDVLKWVLAALAAGFVGQFGRVLAMRIIHRRRAAQATLEASPPAREEPPTSDELRALQKIEKKRAKAEVKRAKKAADGEGGSSSARPDEG
ncbi:MAG: hypothetical protein JSW65_04190 [Candidatus Bipolaricaulota bacterium]|nr:MAG: hypothetical protein JSW65_04190 [Candidatus Bipolaricaulota bacterium]